MDDQQPIAALTEQLSCYRKLAKLCQQQRSFVQQNQTDDLLTVLEARATILGEISRLEQSVSPLKRQWQEVSVVMSEQQRGTVMDMLAETKLLLQQITQADQDDVLLLQQRKLNVGRQIAATSSARQVNHRYAASAYGANSGSRLNVQK